MGRHQKWVSELVRSVDRVKGLRVFDAETTEMSFTFNYRASVNPIWGSGMRLHRADVIVVLDCDVPPLPSANFE